MGWPRQLVEGIRKLGQESPTRAGLYVLGGTDNSLSVLAAGQSEGSCQILNADKVTLKYLCVPHKRVEGVQ